VNCTNDVAQRRAPIRLEVGTLEVVGTEDQRKRRAQPADVLE
jgi:hypothetical protein